MAGNTLIGYINWATTGVLTANSAESTLPVTNLSGFQTSPSTGWQTENGVKTAAAGAVMRCHSPITSSLWRMFGVFNTNLTPSAVVTATWYTLGSPPTAVGSVVAAGPAIGFRQSVGVLAEDVVADFIEIEFDDTTNPDNHVNIGGLFCGPAWQPVIGMGWESSYGSIRQFAESTSRGGQLYREPLYRQRKWNLALQALTDNESWMELADLDQAIFTGGNVMVVPNMVSSTMAREAIFGAVGDVTDVTYSSGFIDTRDWRATIIERL